MTKKLLRGYYSAKADGLSGHYIYRDIDGNEVTITEVTQLDQEPISNRDGLVMVSEKLVDFVRSCKPDNSDKNESKSLELTRRMKRLPYKKYPEI